jgi:hypothetical protein
MTNCHSTAARLRVATALAAGREDSAGSAMDSESFGSLRCICVRLRKEEEGEEQRSEGRVEKEAGDRDAQSDFDNGKDEQMFRAEVRYCFEAPARCVVGSFFQP